MPTVPSGYANVLIPGQHFASARSVAITFGVENNTAITDPSSLADDIWAQFDSSILVALDQDVTWGPIVVSINNGAGVVTAPGTFSDAGGSAIDSVPVNTALLVQKRSVTPGRAGRGRYYIPFALNEADVNEIGLIDTSTVGDHQTIQDDFLGKLTANDTPMVILHSGAGTPAAVTALVVQPVAATQRRRMRP